ARAALAGVGPITGGMTVATALLLIRSTARRGRVHISIDVAVSAVAFVAALAFAIPTVAAIAAGGVIGAFALGREPPTSRQTPMGRAVAPLSQIGVFLKASALSLGGLSSLPLLRG